MKYGVFAASADSGMVTIQATSTLVRCVGAVLGALVLQGAALTSIAPERQPSCGATSVKLNDTRLEKRAEVCWDGDGAIFVTQKDAQSWGLRTTLKPAFQHAGQPYVGLQTQLRLTAALNQGRSELSIVAPPASFLNRAPAAPLPLTAGSGARLSYDVNRYNGTYVFTYARNSTQLAATYVSEHSTKGISFLLGSWRFTRLYPGQGVVQLGTATTDGAWVGRSTPFVGLHLATDYSLDPDYVSYERPYVRGFTKAPSIVEVYVENVLYDRAQVEPGFFEIRDLPTSAANSDVDLIIIDYKGNRTQQIVRPTYDAQMLKPGLLTFAADIGMQSHNTNLHGVYYRGFVVSANAQTGITRSITGVAHVEDIAGNQFFDLGLNLRVGPGGLLGIRSGAGTSGHADEVRYDLVTGKLRFSELLHVNGERVAYNGADLDIQTRIREERRIAYDVSPSFGLSGSYAREELVEGSLTGLAELRMEYRRNWAAFSLGANYDPYAHRLGAQLTITPNVAPPFSARVATSVTQGGLHSTVTTLDLRRTGENGLDLSLGDSFAASHVEREDVTATLPSAVLNFRSETQYGQSNLMYQASGGLVFLHGNAYAFHQDNGDSATALVRIPGYANASVSVNGLSAGRLDQSGEFFVRRLQAFAQNRVAVSVAAGANGGPFEASYEVVPQRGAVLIDPQELVLRPVSAEGRPFAPGTRFEGSDGRAFFVSPSGELVVLGLPLSEYSLQASSDGHSCRLSFHIAQTWRGVRNVGTRQCAV